MIRQLAVFFVSITLSISIDAQTTSTSQGCVPFAVEFDGSGYYWDFGNGQNSNENDPSTVYNAAGTYTVTVYDFDGGPVVNTFDIEAFDPPSIDIQANVVEGCTPLKVDFTYTITNSTVPINSATWIFGDGNSVNSTSSNVTHTYLSGGNMTVTLQVETGIGSCNVSQVESNLITAHDPPNSGFTVDPESSCTSPVTIEITNNTTDINPVTYSWDFGNGNSSTSQNPPDQTFSADGIYDIQLIATNSRSCADTTTYQFNVGSPTGSINVPDTVCLDAGITFEYFAANRVTWDFDNGAEYYNSEDFRYESISTSREKSIEIFYRTSGVKTISLETRNSGCTNTVTKDIYVQEIAINPTVSEEYICINPVTVDYQVTTDASSPSYQWTFSDGSQQTGTNPSQSYFASSDTVYYGVNIETIHTAEVIVTDGTTGCYDTAYVDFSHYPINAKVEINESLATGCAPISISFEDSVSHHDTDPIIEWTWDFGDGSGTVTNTTGGEVTHSYSSAGTYDVFLAIESQTGCTDTSYHVQVDIGEDVSSSLSFVSDQTTICRGDTVELSVTSSIAGIDAFHFYSDGNRIFHQQEDSVVNWPMQYETGPQDVTLMVDINGCISEVTYTDYINVRGAVAEITYDNSCDTPFEYNFDNTAQSAGTLSLSWDFGDGNSSSASSSTHTYASRGSYTVVQTAEEPGSGCDAHQDSVVINITEPIAILAAPSFACGGGEITLDASGSQDPACRGYTFRFPTFNDFQRPITWDKSTATVEIPDVDTVGTHTVELIITDEHGCKDTTSQVIEPYVIDVQAASDISTVCLPQTLNLADSTVSDTTLVSWSWVISSGDTISDQFPSFAMDIPPIDNDTFYISLSVEDALGCTGNADTILALPYYELRSRLIVATDSICVPEEVFFEGQDNRGQGLDFVWDFGNGDIDSTQYPSTNYSVGGNYDIKMIYYQDSTGCMDSLFQTVTIQEQPSAGFYTDVDGDSVYCNPQTITFSDSSQSITGIANRYWNFDNGETSNASDYTLAYTKGQYDVELIVETSYGCSDTVYRSFEIVGPEVEFITDKENICVNEDVTFEITHQVDVDSLIWIFGDGADSVNVDLVTHTYENAPTSFQTIANLFVYSSNGCSQVQTDTIHFYELAAGFIPTDSTGTLDSILCRNEELFLVDQSINADSYNWEFQNGETSTDSDPSTTYLDAGIYTIKQTVENLTWGCVDSAFVNIEIKDLPEPIIQLSADTICLGDDLDLLITNYNDSSSYSWEPSVITAGTGGAASSSPTENMSIYLAETTFFGCLSDAETLVTVIQPYLYNDWDTTIQEGATAVLPVVLDSGYTFSLTPFDGLSCIDCSYPEVSPLEDVSYNLNVQDYFGCWNDNYTLTVFVIPPPFVSMPETFTPNGDGVNDIVYVQGLNIAELLEFNVFNRWGELIFSTTNLSEGWDGKFNGKVQNNDIYAYKIKAIGNDGSTISKEGYLNLVK